MSLLLSRLLTREPPPRGLKPATTKLPGMAGKPRTTRSKREIGH